MKVRINLIKPIICKFLIAYLKFF